MTKASGRGRHSYVQFYPSDWMAGTGRMTRPIRSVYFDVCLYNWDKAQPMPPAELALVLADLEGQGEMIVNLLVNSGKLERDDFGRIWCERALAEGERALSLWAAKSGGGRKRQGTFEEDAPATPASTPAMTLPLEPEPEPEPDTYGREDASHPLSSDADDPLGYGLSGGDGEGEEETPEPEPKGPTKAECEDVVEHWNAMAARVGLAQVTVMSDKRVKGLKTRLKELGVARLKEAIDKIPTRRFCMGHNDRKWKAHFNWFIQPDKAAGLLEGGEQWNGDEGRQSGWK